MATPIQNSKARPERTGIMLAHPVSRRRLSQLGDRYFTQPKLNGERCWVEWFNHSTPMLISSYGNSFELPHISSALIQQGFQGIRLDGELYTHSLTFEEIHSRVSTSRKSLHPSFEEIEFHIFDFKSHLPQHERLSYLVQISFRPPLFFVPTSVLTHPEWEPTLHSYVDLGYEGIILRDFSSSYTETRSPFLLKFKPREHDHYRILDIKEGEGWCTGMLGSFIVSGNDNTPFSIGSGKLLTKENRRALWEQRHTLPGKLLLVAHEYLRTSSGIPKCAVALSVVDPLEETSKNNLS